MALNAKRKKFCLEYLKDLNGTQAAIRAGYSAKSAGGIAREYLQRPEIKEFIDEQLAALQAEQIAAVDEILKYLTSVMRGEGAEEVTVVESRGGYSEARNIEKTLSPKDRLKAAELLGKRYGMFNFDDKRLELERRRLELEYLKLEASQQVAQAGTTGTNFIDALSETSKAVWPDTNDESDED